MNLLNVLSKKFKNRASAFGSAICFIAAVSLFIYTGAAAQTHNYETSVSVIAANGEYTVSASSNPHWVFAGTTGHPLSNIKKAAGTDNIGNFHSISFSWKADNAYDASIRWYDQSPVVVFSLTTAKKANHIEAQFPAFSRFPKLDYHSSFADDVFAPQEFKLNKTSTPWLFFDKNANSFIISPASDFIVSKMTGDGEQSIISGLNARLHNLPAGFTHKTILVFDHGIHQSWKDWGSALRKMYNRTTPANDADKVLKYYGYWTDNGADYYYNYDTTLGYAKTLLKLKARYQQEGIPMGYMQLDSWWYEKSIYDPNGKPDADHKNPTLPSGQWNRYGGLLSYTADPFLFPDGLAAFNQRLGMPMVTHNRWVDPTSPYVKKFKISGYAAVDPAYWKEIIGYIHKANVIVYEQDWLNFLYNKSPEMASDLSVGNAFTDGMANACKADGLNMQYCMAMPRFFMQGVKYNNLTTIRTSDDRFEPRKWKHFIYTSQLGYALGIWPWCDVFKSSETGNMILSVLSGGPVGTGDAMGKENKSNIMMSCRADGVIIKPDVAIVPMDISYINDAQHADKPMMGYTYTKHDNITTNYVFSFSEKGQHNEQVSFKPSQLNVGGEVIVYNPLTDMVKKQRANETFTADLNANHFAYFMIAPVTVSGIAFFGEKSKICGTGKKRIAEMASSNKQLRVNVRFAKGEDRVQLSGYYTQYIQVNKGVLSLNKEKHTFTLTLPAPENGDSQRVIFDTKKM